MKKWFAFAVLCVCVFNAGAQPVPDNAGRSAASGVAGAQGVSLPLKRIVILSSGLAYHEHSGILNGPALLSLPFRAGAVNDALKSLVLNDPAQANPSVTYQSEQTLYQTLKSLEIDLSDNPDLAGILAGLRGAEVEIAVPAPVSGRIVGIEYRSAQASPASGYIAREPWLSLYTSQGLKLFNLKEIGSLSFRDSRLNEDLNRALDLITASRNRETRELLVSLPGSGSRQVSISYVVPAPVWKASYRLDLGNGVAGDGAGGDGTAGGNADGTALFQGWAIVDNDSDTDWNNVRLSLAAGRPASFIQNLYPPYYVSRPVLPLAIAGAAAAASHDSGYALPAPAPDSAMKSVARNEVMRESADMRMMSEPPEASAYGASAYGAAVVAGGTIDGARGSAAGDQFEFTIKNPVSLDRRMSAMLPLVEAGVEARRILIFSGASSPGGNVHPRLGAEITNTSGMKLPAGPITVYDGGTYAGDALIEFWNQDEKRLISFGEDLSVTGTVMDSTSRAVTAVTISGGVMTINRGQTYLKTYTFRNAADTPKQIVVEHPKTPGAALESPEADEQTSQAYRFTMTVNPGKDLVLMVSENRPLSERISLLPQRPETFISYAANQEIPANVRSALQKAVDLRRDVTAAEAAVKDLENRRAGLVSDEERIRKNLEAAGGQTPQGQDYLRRLASLDNDIDALAPELEKARAAATAAQKNLEDYLNGLTL
jgi:hypothetical protein